MAETDAAQKLLEPRIGAEGIEARPQEDTRIKSFFIAFFEPSHRLILIAQSCIAGCAQTGPCKTQRNLTKIFSLLTFALSTRKK
jgi:hypothetical protein